MHLAREGESVCTRERDRRIRKGLTAGRLIKRDRGRESEAEDEEG